MPDKTPYKLELDPQTREELERALCVRIDEAVAAASDRNAQLRIWDDQLEGFGVVAQNQQWANACDLTDPISFESFLIILSQLVGAMHRDPKVAVEAFSKEDDDNARTIESWLSMVASQSDIDGRIYDFAYNASKDPSVVGYVAWSQKTRQRRDIGYRQPDSARVITDDAKEDDVEYEEVPISEEVTEESYDIRAVDLKDFFLYPATATSIERATAVCERMYVTEEELYDGIRDYGYDRDAVEELVAMGPGNHQDEDRQAEADIDGLREDGQAGFYQIYTCYTRLPRRLPGALKPMPEHYLQDDYLVVCSIDARIVLKIALSPFLERPYFIGGILPKPSKSNGHALMGILEGLQSEANANLQLSIDASNIVVSPMVIAPLKVKEDIGKTKVGPGSIVFTDFGGEIRPWPINTNPTRDGLTWQQWISSRARGLVSAEGQGQLQNKVRKNAEVQATETAAGAKFGMYLSNFQRSVVSELFRRIISLKLQFGDVDDDGEDFTDAEGHSHKLTARALRGKYNIVATGTSLTHSPEARIEISKQKQAVQVEYLGAKGKLPPEAMPLIWHGAREILFDLGERNPESWIGEEPKASDPNAQPQQPPQQGPQNGNGNGAGGQQPPMMASQIIGNN